MEPAPVKPNMPNITINIDPAQIGAVELFEEMLYKAAKIFNPPPMVALPEERDEWGTPQRIMEMPDTYDAFETGNDYMQNYVSPMSMLAMRMKWGPFRDRRGLEQGAFNPSVPFDHLTVHMGKERAIVMLVRNGEPVVLDDDLNLYPSDALCTKLRMLLASQP